MNSASTSTSTSLAAKLGILLVLTLGLFLARFWDWQESIAYNLMCLTSPLVFPSPNPQASLQEQAKRLAITTKLMEAQNGWLQAKFMGDSYFQASFGVNRTRVVELHVSSAHLYPDGDPYQIPVLCTCPHNASSAVSLPVVLYYFSGGLLVGSYKTELLLLRWLARQANAVVCAPNYRKVPLYAYPIPIQDALEGSIGLLTTQVKEVEQALDTRMDLERISTWGMSAGGFMSAHMARRLTYQGYRLQCQISLVPMVQPPGITASMLKHWHDEHIVWTAHKNAYSWHHFLPTDHLKKDWMVNLLVDPPQEVLVNLPPAYVQIHTKDILRDEGELYAKRLKKIQGKLIGLDEFNTGHIGGLPGVARGGPGQEAMNLALQTLISHQE